MSLSNLLPEKFVGFLPLYIGVEIILLYGIINKMCGPYGLLSLLTGHPINFIQWLYYLTSTIVLIFFILGFKSIHHPSMNVFSLITMIYLLDTVGGCVFTVYFVWFWFSNESKSALNETTGAGAVGAGAVGAGAADAGAAAAAAADAVVPNLVKRVSEDLSSQSASESYELFMTVSMTLLTTVVRFYFSVVMLSFFKQMVIRSKYNSQFRLSTSADSSNRLRILLNKLEVRSYSVLNKLVS